jgi:hypothetical protein
MSSPFFIDEQEILFGTYKCKEILFTLLYTYLWACLSQLQQKNHWTWGLKFCEKMLNAPANNLN